MNALTRGFFSSQRYIRWWTCATSISCFIYIHS